MPTLRSIVSSYIGGGWGKETRSDDYPIPSRVIRGTDIPNLFVCKVDGVPRRFHTTSNFRSRKLQSGDLVFEVSGGSKDQPVGRVLLIRDDLLSELDGDVIPASFCKRIRPNRGLVEPLFLYYFLCSIYNDRRITQWQVQSTGLSNFKFEDFLDQCNISLPDLNHQRRITTVLSNYDALSELNERRIQVLEKMARALYREWFIHFRFPDNHQRKVESTGPCHSPEGWETKNLESLIVDHIGGGWGKGEPEGRYSDPAWVIRGTDIPDARRCKVEDVPRRFHANSNLHSRRLQAGDIIFEVSGGSKGQPVGRTLLITSELLSAFGEDSVICASFCKRVRPNSKNCDSELLYLSFLEDYESGKIEKYQVQSTGISNFRWTDYIQHTQRVIPPQWLRLRFHELVAPLFAQIATLGLQADNLRRTRDQLLTRLLSGNVNFKLETDHEEL